MLKNDYHLNLYQLNYKFLMKYTIYNVFANIKYN